MIAAVFPGQGSQFVGMSREICQLDETAHHYFDQASSLLGYDLQRLCAEGPEDQLNLTEYAQPALLVTNFAWWNLLLKKLGSLKESTVKIVAGHSLGEYSALLSAGVLTFEDAVRTVAYRGSLMQQAVPAGQGAMAAVIGLEDALVEQICERLGQQYDEIVEPANYNSPSQVVIGGSSAGVTLAIDAMQQEGAKRVIPLNVSVPSHTSLMREAADKLAGRLEEIEFCVPDISLIQNVSADYSSTTDSIKQNLAKQLYSPVLWRQSIEMAISQGEVSQFIECGPGRVLSGLIKRTDRASEVNTVLNFEGV